MSTFAWLLMGHLVGDWLLQNDWMARGKRQGLFTSAGTVHFALYTVTILGTLWLSGYRHAEPATFLALGAIVYLSHWLVDAGNLARRWMRLYRQSERELVRIMVDQTLHLLVLALLAEVIDGA
jgi:threonine/homoserine/homoserine lactone efflux protein